MLKRLAAVALGAALLAGCSNKPEDVAARAAAGMNAMHDKQLDYAKAEGATLVARYKPIRLGQFSDDEVTKLSTAGLCTVSQVRNMLNSGGKIRIELPRGGDFLRIQIDHCDGDKPVVSSGDAVAASGSAGKSNGWPTNASIKR